MHILHIYCTYCTLTAHTAQINLLFSCYYFMLHSITVCVNVYVRMYAHVCMHIQYSSVLYCENEYNTRKTCILYTYSVLYMCSKCKD